MENNKMMSPNTRRLTKKIVKFLIPAMLGIIFILWIGLPLLMAILWSLVDPEHPWSYPQTFPEALSTYHWVHIFKYTAIGEAIANSFFIAFATTILSFLLSLPTAYALGRRNLRGRETLKIGMLLPIVFPGMALALFLGRVFITLGLSQTYMGVIMAHTIIAMPFMMRILTVSFESIPQEIIDAAENLGAGPWVKLKEVYFPMILPGFLAGSIFSFIASMEEFNLTFIIGAPEIQTIPTVLFSYLGANFLRTSASVVSLILVIPNIILLIITERFIKTEYLGAALGKM
ncbi:MAG: ABC transporter permease [Butyricicoccus pullicaecorum]|jgi:putative spermidine/putrescine transport system permease protein|nr:ABC transporter permease [Butyricicoccus pullicaecorum]